MVYITEELERYVLRYQVSNVVRYYYLKYLEYKPNKNNNFKIPLILKKVGDYYRHLLKLYSELLSEFCKIDESYGKLMQEVIKKASISSDIDDENNESVITNDLNNENNTSNKNDTINDQIRILESTTMASTRMLSDIDMTNISKIRSLPLLELIKIVNTFDKKKKKRYERLLESLEKKTNIMEELFIKEYQDGNLLNDFVIQDGENVQMMILTPSKIIILGSSQLSKLSQQIELPSNNQCNKDQQINSYENEKDDTLPSTPKEDIISHKSTDHSDTLSISSYHSIINEVTNQTDRTNIDIILPNPAKRRSQDTLEDIDIATKSTKYCSEDTTFSQSSQLCINTQDVTNFIKEVRDNPFNPTPINNSNNGDESTTIIKNYFQPNPTQQTTQTTAVNNTNVTIQETSTKSFSEKLRENKQNQQLKLNEIFRNLKQLMQINNRDDPFTLYAKFIDMCQHSAQQVEMFYQPIPPKPTNNNNNNNQHNNTQTLPSHNPIQDEKAKARRLRALYRKNTKRCFREVTKPITAWCEATASSIVSTLQPNNNDNFQQQQTSPINSSTTNTDTQPIQDTTTENPINNDNIVDNPTDEINDNSPYHHSEAYSDFHISPEDVGVAIERAKKDSSPGTDGIQMVFWKRIPGIEYLLSSLFNTIIQHQKVPDDWLISRLVMIPKEDNPDTTNPLHYRPISITQTIYRIFMSVLSRKLFQIVKLSPSQKGFCGGDGCVEQSYILQEIINDARRRRKKMNLVWIDIKKAFDSVPHNIIIQESMNQQFPTTITNLLKHLYSNCYNQVTDKDGNTDILHSNGYGVRQGCPLSPLLFNISINPFLDELDNTNLGYAMDQKIFTGLAYADDIVFMSSTTENMQLILQKFEQFLNSTNLKVNHSKCSYTTLSFNCSRRIVNDPSITPFKLFNMEIPKLNNFYKYLGTTANLQTFKDLPSCFDEFMQNLRKLTDCPLFGFMKLEMLRTYMFPTLDYCMKTNILRIDQLNKIDAAVLKAVRSWLNIPSFTNKAMFYCPTNQGGLGLRQLTKDYAALRLSSGLNLIHSPDDRVKAISRQSLQKVVRKRTHTQPLSPVEYLNLEKEQTITHDIKSLISSIRMNRKSLKIRITQNDDNDPTSVDLDLSTILLPDNIFHDSRASRYNRQWISRVKRLRWHYQLQHLNNWSEMLNQGRSLACFGADKLSNSWIRTGNIEIAAYRFGILGRVNCLPTKAVLFKTQRSPDPRCRHCNCDVETLRHILNGCQISRKLQTHRHDKILELIQKRLKPNRNWELRINKQIPNISSTRRPDIVLMNHKEKKVVIVEITICYEQGQESMCQAKMYKSRKYLRESSLLENLGYHVQLDALVFGSLGSHHVENVDVLRMLGIRGKKPMKILHQAITTTALESSYAVWKKHMRRTQANSQH